MAITNQFSTIRAEVGAASRFFKNDAVDLDALIQATRRLARWAMTEMPSFSPSDSGVGRRHRVGARMCECRGAQPAVGQAVGQARQARTEQTHAEPPARTLYVHIDTLPIEGSYTLGISGTNGRKSRQATAPRAIRARSDCQAPVESSASNHQHRIISTRLCWRRCPAGGGALGGRGGAQTSGNA